MSFALARELMADFAVRTGLDGPGPPRRYLWTDAYAVGNFLALEAEDGDPGRWRGLALRLVHQVHHVLGRHRADDPRDGWISGLGDEAGERHPTAGGLRIGKELPERAPGDPLDPRREWDRDGQYFHYLTRWMHALARVAAVTGDAVHLRHARELAAAAHAGFTAELPDGGRRMFWKMSIDLSRPLVPSQGHHDPLDGLLTYLELDRAEPAADSTAGPDLDDEIAAAAEMCAGTSWATDDPLGLGGLLADVARLGRLTVESATEGTPGRTPEGGVDPRKLLHRLLEDARTSLRRFAATPHLRLPPEQRLAFRELGLAIGLHAVEHARQRHGDDLELPVAAALDDLRAHRSLAQEIEAFWSDPDHRRSTTWTGHRDINDVMLATSLAPEGWLGASPDDS